MVPKLNSFMMCGRFFNNKLRMETSWRGKPLGGGNLLGKPPWGTPSGENLLEIFNNLILHLSDHLNNLLRFNIIHFYILLG